MGIGSGILEGSSSSASASPSIDCDVGLALRMQSSESFLSSGFNSAYGGHRGSGPSSSVYQSTGKILFTANQLQELEKQTLICKYIMASIPVPPQLLISIKAQSNSNLAGSGLDLRFSTGSDPEPWRCRRTDGKKWRCSRDVAPEQKYCERHAHKTRTRSRKPVENPTQTQTQTQIVNKASSHTNNYTNRPPVLPVYTPDPFQIPVSPFDPSRCPEWFMKGGNTANNQEYNHLQTSSSSSPLSRSIGFKRDISYFNQYEDDHHTPLNFIDPYINGQDCLDETTHTTRHFIDAWSNNVERDVNVSNNNSNINLSYSERKLPLSSLTLSMSGSENEENVEGEREFLKSHWLNPAMWMGSPSPGGPLGEALCLGPAAQVAGPACSKNSSDDVSQGGLNFR